MTDTEIPEDRVRRFIDTYIEWEGDDADFIQSTGSRYDEVKLTVTDVRDLLNEKTAAEARIAELEERILVTRQYAERYHFDIHMGAVHDMLAEEGDAEQGEPITAEND